MGYAYEWLTEKEKNNITFIKIEYAANKICLVLKVLETFHSFEYRRDFEGATAVVDVQKKKDARINKYFVDVACEDFDSLAANQKSKLQWLFVEPVYDTVYDQKTLDPIINKIFEHLSTSVASRSSPLQVTRSYVSPTKVSEGMSVIRHLDQSELRDVVFRFYARNEPGKIDDTMIGWNGDSGWKRLWFYLESVTKEDLNGIASSQRFDEILVKFKSCYEENIGSFFDTKLLNLRITKTQISIQPYITRGCSCFDKKKTLLSENLALEVLGNSAIMEIILEELQFFDIQRLRKVCRGVRDCIDDVKPEPHINACKVGLDRTKIKVDIR